MSRLVEYADELVTSVGPRPGASKGEHQAAELIAQNLEDMGLDTYIQEFSCARSTGWVRILYYLLAALAAFILFFAPGLKALALVLALLGAVLLALDLLGKNPLFDLLNKGLSQNVVARYIPDGADSRRKVIVVAHYDSGRSMVQCAPIIASSYTFLRTLIRASVVGLLLVIILSLLPLPEVLLLILGVLGIVLGVVVLVAALFEVINLFLPFNQGANCNASGVAALYGVAQSLTGNRSSSFGGNAKQQQARSRRSSRTAGRSRANDYDDEADYQDDDQQSGRRATAGATSGAATAGAVGSIFSKAKGLVSKKDDDQQADFDASSTADLGSTVAATAAANAASSDSANDQVSGLDVRSRPRQAGVRLATSAGADLAGANDGLRQVDAVRPVANPAIRTRAPLAVQEEQERLAREKAEETRQQQSGRTADGLPEWFVNAKKKAAQKDSNQRSKAPEEHEPVRSQFADMPLTSDEIAAKAKTVAKPSDKSGRTTNVAKSIFAEPQLQSIRPDDKQDEKQDPGSQAEVEVLSGKDNATDPTLANRQEGSTKSAAQLLQERLSQKPIEPEPVRRKTNLPDVNAAQSQPASKQQISTQPDSEQPSSTQPDQSQTPKSPQSSLQMDFSGLDRLSSDAGPLEKAAAAPTPVVPTNERLRSIPRISLGDSGMIPTQQAAFHEQASPSEQLYQPEDSLVSSTGSFAPLGATGLMQPVGEELLNYHDQPEDIYIDDSDDGWAQSSGNATAGSAPHIIEIPKSRSKSFFGGLGDKLSGGSKKRSEDLDSSPSSWLGVDDDFDARNAGSEIGSWENFSEQDDDSWKGGAYGGYSDQENQEVLQSFSSELIDKEVWVVALGSHENKNAGLKSFLQEHERDLRNALIINIDGVGAGDLCFTVSEGTFRTLNTDHRLQNLAEAAGRSAGADLEPVKFTGYTTDASAALKAGMRAISILGLDKSLPVGWRWSDDRLDVIDEDNLQTVSDIVVEMIKSS